MVTTPTAKPTPRRRCTNFFNGSEIARGNNHSKDHGFVYLWSEIKMAFCNLFPGCMNGLTLTTKNKASATDTRSTFYSNTVHTGGKL